MRPEVEKELPSIVRKRREGTVDGRPETVRNVQLGAELGNRRSSSHGHGDARIASSLDCFPLLRPSYTPPR